MGIKISVGNNNHGCYTLILTRSLELNCEGRGYNVFEKQACKGASGYQPNQPIMTREHSQDRKCLILLIIYKEELISQLPKRVQIRNKPCSKRYTMDRRPKSGHLLFCFQRTAREGFGLLNSSKRVTRSICNKLILNKNNFKSK